MDWNEIRERLDKAFDAYESAPTNEHDRLVAQVWYWHGIAEYARIMTEDIEDNNQGYTAMQSGKPA